MAPELIAVACDRGDLRRILLNGNRSLTPRMGRLEGRLTSAEHGQAHLAVELLEGLREAISGHRSA